MTRHVLLLMSLIVAGPGCIAVNRTSHLAPPTSSPVAIVESRTQFAELQKASLPAADIHRTGGVADPTPSETLVRASGDSDSRSLPPLSPPHQVPLVPLEPPPEPIQQTAGASPSVPNLPQRPPIFEPEMLPPPNPPVPVEAAGRVAPTVTGQRLQLGPRETAAERAVQLAQMLEAADAELMLLRERVRTLERQVQDAEQGRAIERQEAAKSAAELARSRVRLEALDEQLAAMRERLRRAERQDLETLQEVVTVLERLLDDNLAN